MNYFGERNYAEISIRTIKTNLKLLKKEYALPKVMSVIKADGYGHGIDACVQALDQDTDWYGVASYDEAKKIRKCNSNKPILVLGIIPLEKIKEADSLNIRSTLVSTDYAEELNNYCQKHNIIYKCHLTFDTGFSRIGIQTDKNPDLEKKVDTVYHLDNLKIEGVYTHFASAGSQKKENIKFTEHQFSEYLKICKYIEKNYGSIKIKHCCNSRATFYNPDFHLDMVRIGMYLFGLGPDEDREKIGLTPALRWKAKVVMIKQINIGDTVSYSRTFTATKKMRIGIISCGFGDGYYRSLFRCEKPIVLVQGHRCHILGKICMDYFMVELPNFIDTENLDEVMLIGTAGTEEVTANELAGYVGGTGVEVTSQITARVKRILV